MRFATLLSSVILAAIQVAATPTSVTDTIVERDSSPIKINDFSAVVNPDNKVFSIDFSTVSHSDMVQRRFPKAECTIKIKADGIVPIEKATCTEPLVTFSWTKVPQGWKLAVSHAWPFAGTFDHDTTTKIFSDVDGEIRG